MGAGGVQREEERERREQRGREMGAHGKKRERDHERTRARLARRARSQEQVHAHAHTHMARARGGLRPSTTTHTALVPCSLCPASPPPRNPAHEPAAPHHLESLFVSLPCGHVGAADAAQGSQHALLESRHAPSSEPSVLLVLLLSAQSTPSRPQLSSAFHPVGNSNPEIQWHALLAFASFSPTPTAVLERAAAEAMRR